MKTVSCSIAKLPSLSKSGASLVPTGPCNMPTVVQVPRLARENDYLLPGNNSTATPVANTVSAAARPCTQGAECARRLLPAS